MPLDTSSRFAEAIRVLEQSRAEAMQRHDDAKADMERAAHDVRDIDEILDVIAAKVGETKPYQPASTPQPSAVETEAQTEDSEVKTTRFYIRRFLKAASKPQTPVDIARALVAEGVFSDYKKAKATVDTNLKRMKQAGGAARDDEGWYIKDDQLALSAA